jgi:hypothetical protein
MDSEIDKRSNHASVSHNLNPGEGLTPEGIFSLRVSVCAPCALSVRMSPANFRVAEDRYPTPDEDWPG